LDWDDDDDDGTATMVLEVVFSEIEETDDDGFIGADVVESVCKYW